MQAGYRYVALAVGLPLIAVAVPSQAQESGWQGSLGAGAIYSPDYLGSDDYETSAWPSVDLTYGDSVYINARDGVGWNVINRDGWRVSPFLGYTFGRDNDDDLNRLDEVDGGVTAGLRAEYTEGHWLYSAAVETPVSGDVDGYHASAKAHWRSRLTQRLSVSLGPSVAYGSESWAEDMFGISARESQRSGLDAYAPSEGYFKVGADASASYYLTRTWSVTGMVGVSRLTGDAKDSPIVDEIGDETQAYVGGFINYNF
ncbi:MipA/OmpV family protein [Chromohalobacter canadensis]|uniref:MipA/OmpV family protein n=1 Tax=Chromohalobacter canadensis TaxID=141389 RepID=UPI0021BF25E3|nr:MipA/OmpV family protein [Chromohalobacter canadensis]MCT8468802.1 MipA/OmpV family protein [Chromohalobacter canadensis]MCT8473008.1 MipA/OmpV family protein [Chromohalobacter canadensis]MCT8500460.1 MipA/OmpV family protein [Chromohalobacter canadensis]